MHTPTELRFASTHEWARLEDSGLITVGISDHAQSELGDIVFVELPEASGRVEQGEQCAVVESVKAASDIYAPLSGQVVAVNDSLGDQPEIINQSPYDDGWLFRIEPDDSEALRELLDASAYEASLNDE